MSLYRGFSTIANTFGSSRLEDLELVKRNLLNHFATRKGEKLHNPEFGSNIHDLIMEQINDETKDLLLDEVNTVLNFDPRVRINQVIVDEYENGLLVNANLTFLATDETQTLQIKFDRQDGTVQ